MQENKYSRRGFMEKSIGMAVILSPVLAVLPKSAMALPITGLPTSNERDRLQELLGQKEPIKWVFTGDSITHGAKHTFGYRSYPEIFAERIRWEMKRSRDLVINTGISGNTSSNILIDFEWRVGQFNPTVVSVMIGTNDCANNKVDLKKYEENLNELIHKIRNGNAIPIFNTPNPILEEGAPERSGLREYVGIFKETAIRQNVVLVDHWGYWEDHSEDNIKPQYSRWLNDPLHPNAEGHLEIARLIFKELLIFDEKDFTCSGTL